MPACPLWGLAGIEQQKLVLGMNSPRYGAATRELSWSWLQPAGTRCWRRHCLRQHQVRFWAVPRRRRGREAICGGSQW